MAPRTAEVRAVRVDAFISPALQMKTHFID